MDGVKYEIFYFVSIWYNIYYIHMNSIGNFVLSSFFVSVMFFTPLQSTTYVFDLSFL